MTIPTWLQGALTLFETSNDPFMEVAVFEALRNVANKQAELTEAERQACIAEMLLFQFIPTRTGKTSPWDTYFSPMAIFIQDDGSEVRIPDIRTFNGDSVTHWEERARAVNQPVMRARYADAVWDLKNAITKQRPSHEFARLAIDSYIEAVANRRFAHEMDAVQWLRRALDLSFSLNDAARAQQVTEALFTLHAAIANPSRAGTWIFAFDLLYERKDLLTKVQRDKIIADLEEMLAKTSAHGTPEFDPFGAEAAAERLAQHYRKSSDTGNVHRVIKAYGEAFATMAREAGPMHAVAWLQPVIEKYEQEGLKKEAEALQLLASEKAKNIESEMKTVSVPLQIKKEELEDWLDRMTSDDLDTVLQRIAVHFIPRVNDVKAQLEMMRNDTPFVAMISVTRFDADGRPVGKVGSIDEDPDGRLHYEIGRSIEFQQPFLVATLDRVRERHAPTVEQFLDLLKQAPLFAGSADSLLKSGLEAYWDGDFVKAIHVLVPRIERSLRDLLALLGIPTVKTVNRAPGIRDVKNMNDVLEDERVQEALTENVWRYLRILYIDRKGGFNLRNDLAHGISGENVFNRAIADRVFHSLLVLSLIRYAEGEKTAGHNDAGPTRAGVV